MDLIASLKRARGVGCPLVAISTADQPALVSTLAQSLNGKAPVLVWDMIRGFKALNELARDIAPGLAATNPVDAVMAGLETPERTAIVLYNFHLLVDNPGVIQALMNIRDAFKASERTIIMIGASFKLPAELTQDVYLIDEPLPDRATITAIITGFLDSNGVEHSPELENAATDATTGLSAFSVEQATALALDLKSRTLDLDALWARKARALPAGLTLEFPKMGFDQVGGLANWKTYATNRFNGKRPPKVILFVDEMEKGLAGAIGPVGDNTGIAQGIHEQFLVEMADREYSGANFVGPGGSGKSHAARATAAAFGLPLLKMDIGALKSPHPGESERAARALWKAVFAMAGHGGAMVLGTVNRLDAISPELKRRFWDGIWFFDLADESERIAVGEIHAAKYGIDLDSARKFFAACDGWSSANIKNCCDLADRMNIGLKQAAAYIVPAATQDPAGLESLRAMAAGKFLSASYAGTYHIPDKPAPKITRRIAED